MRWLPWMLGLLLIGSTVAQFQPLEVRDFSELEAREDLTGGDALAGAQRVARFVQVSDAHIVDDDAPEPIRVAALDDAFYASTISDGASRPQEEYTDEVLNSMIQAINGLHLADGLDFVLNTGDNIDNELENELMRFIDNWEGTLTTTGPISQIACAEDGPMDADVEDNCTYLPRSVSDNNVPLANGLPWFSAFGNHDGLIQGNVPAEPSFNDLAAEFGRLFLDQTQYVGMHFRAGTQCLQGSPAGDFLDDYGHGYGFAGGRLCDDDPDNDGYYAFNLRGVRYVVLDTVNDDFVNGNENLAGNFATETTLGYDVVGGYAEGALDPVQFDWLLNEIDVNSDQLVVIFSHHTVNSMFTDDVRPVCCGPNGESLEDLLQASGFKTGPEIELALAERPNVVAWFGGHTHQHQIQAKTSFWNVETSSLIDMPQEARAIEIWVTANGTKGFLALDRIGHEFQPSRDLAVTDEQFDQVKATGESKDQDVLLWFDIPAGVKLTPQPSLPQNLVLRVTEPQAINGTHAQAGDNVTVVLAITENLHGAAVAGLDVSMRVNHAGPDGISRVDFDEALEEIHPGLYAGTFAAPDGASYFASLRASDPSGTFSDATKLVSFQVADDAATPSEKKSPGLPLLAIGAVMLGLARQKR